MIKSVKGYLVEVDGIGLCAHHVPLTTAGNCTRPVPCYVCMYECKLYLYSALIMQFMLQITLLNAQSQWHSSERTKNFGSSNFLYFILLRFNTL